MVATAPPMCHLGVEAAEDPQATSPARRAAMPGRSTIGRSARGLLARLLEWQDPLDCRYRGHDER